MEDEYEIIEIAEYENGMTEKEAREACKKVGAEIIDANHFCNPKIKINGKYLHCFVVVSDGSVLRGDGGYGYFDFRQRGVFVGFGLDFRRGVVGMRKKRM